MGCGSAAALAPSSAVAKLRRCILVVIAGVSVAWVVLLTFRPRLPMHGGRDVAEWLQIGYGFGMTRDPADRAEADAAVRAIGAAAVPYPIQELGATHSAHACRAASISREWRILGYGYRYPDERRRRALGGLAALGTAAAFAAPAIAPYTRDPELRADAQFALDIITGRRFALPE